jgi:hypothetical protein
VYYSNFDSKLIPSPVELRYGIRRYEFLGTEDENIIMLEAVLDRIINGLGVIKSG